MLFKVKAALHEKALFFVIASEAKQSNESVGLPRHYIPRNDRIISVQSGVWGVPQVHLFPLPFGKLRAGSGQEGGQRDGRKALLNPHRLRV